MSTAARRTLVSWIVALVVITLLMLSVRSRLDKAHVALLFLLVVLGASAAGGRVLGLAVAAGAFLAFDYLFLPPYHTLVIADPLDWLVLLTFLTTSVVAAQLLDRARANTAIAVARAREVDRLATLGAETLAAPSAADALQSIAEVIRVALSAQLVELYRLDTRGGLLRTTIARDAPTNAAPEQALASWFGSRVRVALQLPDGTTRLDPGSIVGLDARIVDRTLDVRDQSVGVLRVVFANSTALTMDRARLLDALAYYAALGVERVRLEATAEHAEAERRVESLRSALLMSVSHDLRTPLTTIKALAHEISESGPSSAARIIEQEADRLDALVGDLLELSRIQAGALQSVPSVNTVDELIGTALQRAHGALGARVVAVTLPDEMLIALYDHSQALRIVVNLLENAAKYSPSDTGIELTARREGSWVCVEVADAGLGVPSEEAERIFEPFYRPQGTPPDTRGTGLGLSIARGLAEAQGGHLQYRARDGGGSVFTLSLRAAEGPASESL